MQMRLLNAAAYDASAHRAPMLKRIYRVSKYTQITREFRDKS